MMCEWEVCPQPMEVYANANGAMTGIHVAFFYIVVSVLLFCLAGKKPDLSEIGGSISELAGIDGVSGGGGGGGGHNNESEAEMKTNPIRGMQGDHAIREVEEGGVVEQVVENKEHYGTTADSSTKKTKKNSIKKKEKTKETPNANPAENWESHAHETSGKTYYHNNLTGETTWEMPACLK